jgi:hypothetical protein
MMSRVKWLELMKIIFITHLNTFGSKMFITLKIMDFENVALTKVVHIYVIERALLHNIHDIKSNFNQNVFISNMKC